MPHLLTNFIASKCIIPYLYHLHLRTSPGISLRNILSLWVFGIAQTWFQQSKTYCNSFLLSFLILLPTFWLESNTRKSLIVTNIKPSNLYSKIKKLLIVNWPFMAPSRDSAAEFLVFQRANRVSSSHFLQKKDVLGKKRLPCNIYFVKETLAKCKTQLNLRTVKSISSKSHLKFHNFLILVGMPWA